MILNVLQQKSGQNSKNEESYRFSKLFEYIRKTETVVTRSVLLQFQKYLYFQNQHIETFKMSIVATRFATFLKIDLKGA